MVTLEESLRNIALSITREGEYRYENANGDEIFMVPESIEPIISTKEQKQKLNAYLTLKLEGGKTNIYIKGKMFRQCKFLLLNLEPNKEYKEIENIDEAAKQLSTAMEHDHSLITPEEEFFGHCSNLQAWIENGYDLRIIHTNLGFPLACELVKEGCKEARLAIVEEVSYRLIKNLPNALPTLQKYLKYFRKEEYEVLIEDIKKNEAFVDYCLMRVIKNDYYFETAEEMIEGEFDPTLRITPPEPLNGYAIPPNEFLAELQQTPVIHRETFRLDDPQVLRLGEINAIIHQTTNRINVSEEVRLPLTIVRQYITNRNEINYMSLLHAVISEARDHVRDFHRLSVFIMSSYNHFIKVRTNIKSTTLITEYQRIIDAHYVRGWEHSRLLNDDIWFIFESGDERGFIVYTLDLNGRRGSAGGV